MLYLFGISQQENIKNMENVVNRLFFLITGTTFVLLNFKLHYSDVVKISDVVNQLLCINLIAFNFDTCSHSLCVECFNKMYYNFIHFYCFGVNGFAW
jgi:hypothetical protein